MAVAAAEDGIVVDQGTGKIVFFDVETTIPFRRGQKHELLEFGAIVLDVEGLCEVYSYNTLIRPKDLGSVTRRSMECNGITKESLANAPAFADVADAIYRLLNGRIWAGHNILKFDILRVNEAFSEIDRPAPEPAGIVDTYPLLRETFGQRAGNLKLATLANYCGYGKQEHRSLADVRMNLDVLKSCATMLFLESNYPTVFTAVPETSSIASALKQSAKYSISQEEIRRAWNDCLPEENDIQSEVSESFVKSTATTSRLSQEHIRDRDGTSSKGKDVLLEVSQSLMKSTMTFGPGNTEFGAHPRQNQPLNEIFEESVGTCEVHYTSKSNLMDAREVENGGSSDLFAVSSALKDVSVGEYVQKEVFNNSLGAAHVLNEGHGESNVGFSEVSSGDVGCPENMGDKSGANQEDGTSVQLKDPVYAEVKTIMLNSSAAEGYDSSEELFSLSTLTINDTKDVESSEIFRTRNKCSTSMKWMCDADSRQTEDAEREPFLVASSVSLALIEAHEKVGHFGHKIILYHKGLPLQLLESKIRIRFTVNTTYAFDDKGKPKFSIMIEPSEPACEVISKCDDLVKSTLARYGGEATWRPTLMMDIGGVKGARLSIGTKGLGDSATYTTKFYRHSPHGVVEVVLGRVDSAVFRDLLPHGSIVDVGFGFDVFNFNGHSGIRLLAKYLTLT